MSEDEKYQPCVNLDYDEAKYGDQSDLVTVTIADCSVQYWHRNVVPHETARRNVQFCKKKGRINDFLGCYGSEHCWEKK